MTKSASLRVQVKDHKNHETSAEVSVQEVDDRDWRTLVYDPDVRHHVATVEAPGHVTLRARGKAGWLDTEQRIAVHPGENQIRMAVGPPDVPSYTSSDGARVFFEPLPKLGIDGHGANVRRRILERLPPSANVRHRRSPTAEDAAADNVSCTVELAGDSDQRGHTSAAIAAAVDGLNCEGCALRMSMPIQRSTGAVQWFTGELVIEFKDGVSAADRKAVLDAHGLILVDDQLSFLSNNLCKVRRIGVPHHDVLGVAGQLCSNEHVHFAEPERLYEIVTHELPEAPPRPNDFLFPEQPELYDIAAPAAWAALGNAGSPDIVVAVVDPEGVHPAHPNLPAPLANWDFVNGRPQDQAGLGEDHGTQCASSAVGRLNNGEGTVGIAGGCSLIGARIPDRISACNLAAVWLWAAGLHPQRPLQSRGADVIVNAWAPEAGGWADSLEPSEPIQRALCRLTTEGRGRHGCVVCFSAGNVGYQQVANTNGFSRYPQAITVGASIKSRASAVVDSTHAAPQGSTLGLMAVRDTRAYYSPYGSEITLVAPSSSAENGGTIVDPIVSATSVGHGKWIGRACYRTVLTAPAKAQASTLMVNSINGFMCHGVALIEEPGCPTREFVRITAIEDNRLTIDPLKHPHETNAKVSTGPLDYGPSFGGTSYAVSTVAGAAALILSANPALTWRQVRDVLCDTAVKVDSGQPHPDGKWKVRDSRQFSNWYGYGRLNVAAAVQAALKLRKL